MQCKLVSQSIFGTLHRLCTGLSLAVLACSLWGCTGVDGHERVDKVAVSQYNITVYRAIEQEAGPTLRDTSSYTGTNTLWRPGIARMELGPEPTNLGIPVAALWMSGQLENCDFESRAQCGEGLSRTDDCHFTFNFYSIERPWDDIGNQDAYFYNHREENGDDWCFTLGVDRKGVEFIEGVGRLSFIRQPPAIGPYLPEKIGVVVEFTALND